VYHHDVSFLKSIKFPFSQKKCCELKDYYRFCQLVFNSCELLLHYCVLWLFQSNVPCMLSGCFYQKLQYVSFQLVEVRKIECGIDMLK